MSNKIVKQLLFCIIPLIILVLVGNILAENKTSTKKPSIPELSPAALKDFKNQTQNYRNEKIKQCLSEVLEKASFDVDSILLERALFIGADTIDKPPKPIRPEHEAFIPVNKNVPLKPFLNKSDFISPPNKTGSLKNDSISHDINN